MNRLYMEIERPIIRVRKPIGTFFPHIMVLAATITIFHYFVLPNLI